MLTHLETQALKSHPEPEKRENPSRLKDFRGHQLPQAEREAASKKGTRAGLSVNSCVEDTLRG